MLNSIFYNINFNMAEKQATFSKETYAKNSLEIKKFDV